MIQPLIKIEKQKNTFMIILGLKYYFHDSTACIVKDEVLDAAIEEERLNRDKHIRSFPKLAIDRCFKIAGLNYKKLMILLYR